MLENKLKEMENEHSEVMATERARMEQQIAEWTQTNKMLENKLKEMENEHHKKMEMERIRMDQQLVEERMEMEQREKAENKRYEEELQRLRADLEKMVLARQNVEKEAENQLQRWFERGIEETNALWKIKWEEKQEETKRVLLEVKKGMEAKAEALQQALLAAKYLREEEIETEALRQKEQEMEMEQIKNKWATERSELVLKFEAREEAMKESLNVQTMAVQYKEEELVRLQRVVEGLEEQLERQKKDAEAETERRAKEEEEEKEDMKLKKKEVQEEKERLERLQEHLERWQATLEAREKEWEATEVEREEELSKIEDQLQTARQQLVEARAEELQQEREAVQQMEVQVERTMDKLLQEIDPSTTPAITATASEVSSKLKATRRRRSLSDPASNAANLSSSSTSSNSSAPLTSSFGQHTRLRSLTRSTKKPEDVSRPLVSSSSSIGRRNQPPQHQQGADASLRRLKSKLRKPTVIPAAVKQHHPTAKTNCSGEAAKENVASSNINNVIKPVGSLVFRPTKEGDVVQSMLAEAVKKVDAASLGLDMVISHIGGSTYRFGNRGKVNLRVVNDNLLVRVGGGWQPLVVFLEELATKSAQSAPRIKAK
ncbi:hypothetical protein QOT17_013882 [Balamuthia mandrillaris]